MAREKDSGGGSGGSGGGGGKFAELRGLVERLCARCEALAREARDLRAENRRLRGRSAKAKAKLERLLLTLPRE